MISPRKTRQPIQSPTRAARAACCKRSRSASTVAVSVAPPARRGPLLSSSGSNGKGGFKGRARRWLSIASTSSSTRMARISRGSLTSGRKASLWTVATACRPAASAPVTPLSLCVFEFSEAEAEDAACSRRSLRACARADTTVGSAAYCSRGASLAACRFNP